jgi:DNA-binding transcriptional regulator YiaG
MNKGTMNNETKKYVDVPVRIPNLEGDGIAETHMAHVPVTVDPDTGEELLTEEAIGMIDDTKARYMGLLLPDEIKEMRERLGLTQKRMSVLLQAGEKSYTRWESGRARPSRMVNVLLRLLYDGKVFVSDLITQREQGVNWRDKVVCRLQRQQNYAWTHVDSDREQWDLCPSHAANENLALAA